MLRTIKKTFQDPHQLVSEQVTLENGQTSQTTYQYLPSGSALGAVSALNLITEKGEYDFGSNGVAGALKRKTVTNYATFLSAPTFPNYPAILNRPSSVSVYDGNSTRRTETDFGYDAYGSGGVAAVSATGHDDTNYGTSFTVRGNATSVTTKCFIPGTATTCNDAKISYGFDQAGQVISATDANGNTTNYSYADNFSSGTAPSNTNAYLTKITYPSTNGVTHIESFFYNFSDGKMTKTTDQNNQQTRYFYQDDLRRLTEVDSPSTPDGTAKTFITYNESAPPFSVTTSKTINASRSLVSTAIVDGMGHVTQTQFNSDPAGVSYVDTTYDGFGRRISVSNPHRSASSSTDGITQMKFDPLGRITKITNQDGSVKTIAYSGNCTTTTDEAIKSLESCDDALGRVDPYSKTHRISTTRLTLNMMRSEILSVLNNMEGLLEQDAAHRRVLTQEVHGGCAALPTIRSRACLQRATPNRG